MSSGSIEAIRNGAAVTVTGVVPMFTSCEASRSKSSCRSAGVLGAMTTRFASSNSISTSTTSTGSAFASTIWAGAGTPSTSTLTAASE